MNIAYNMDCMEAMRKMPDKCFDLAVCDPPYFSGPERRGYYGQKVSKIGVHRDYPISPKWDIPGREYFQELQRVSKKYIVWCCITLTLCLHQEESSGTNAIKGAVFPIAK